jgi:prepilin-type N-terminal cleavage/methylation domain-containing protein
MTVESKGFSLIEMLVALTVALTVVTMTFQLFHRNERVIRDQTLVMEMQQTARVVVSQIADEIRMAGQGVPIYASNFDTVPSEATAVILASSNTNRIDFRAGLSNVETAISSGGPIDFTIGVPRSVTVASTAGLAAGKFVYISGATTSSTWAWTRAELLSVSSTTLTLIPRNSGTADATIYFVSPPTVALEEAVSIYLSGGSVRRATANNTSNPATPVWSAANEIGRNFTALTFIYYDALGNVVQPTSLTNRLAITRVDLQLTVTAAGPLSNGSRPTYSLTLRTIARNPRLRYLNAMP